MGKKSSNGIGSNIRRVVNYYDPVERSLERRHELEMARISGGGGVTNRNHTENHTRNESIITHNQALNYNELTKEIKELEARLQYGFTKDHIDEKKRIRDLYEAGAYYFKDGKMHIDQKKFDLFVLKNSLNKQFDTKLEHDAYKAYNKYAKKRFGRLTYHNSPEEQRIKINDPITYKQIEYEKNQFLNNYKYKREKNRKRYVTNRSKKNYFFNKRKI